VSHKLVIVESPTKVKSISKYLGDDYTVMASVGHIRDLIEPKNLPAEQKKGSLGKFSVDVENGFEPYYVVSDAKKKTVTELKRALKDSDELILATDEDREGEAIAWHLLEVLKPKVPVKRMVFHEITQEAIEAARDKTRDIDDHLVDAQETRRILDRLYGYEISPVLWRKVGPGLSAGRVQSAATRLIVDRERERLAFVAANYWGVQADLSATGQAFGVRLTRIDGDRVATGRDFDDHGKLTGEATILTEPTATALADALAAGDIAVTVANIESKPYTRRPAAPFTTSTLQQEASRKLGFSARQTMSVAQSLYENGHITYMRTDSSNLSAQALSAARSQARELYGAETVPEKPRFYGSKQKNAQEAHEAIRPAGSEFQRPRDLTGVSDTERKLYDLIWKRTVASQMADAKGQTQTVTFAGAAHELPDAAGTLTKLTTEYQVSGTVITFRGFLAAYEEGRDVDRYASDAEGKAAEGAKETRLPQMAEGDPVTASDLTADGHRTSPPPRFTEASLVKALEERGIGRPSTYAATISVIQDRGYVTSRGQALVPSWLAFAVTRLLEENFDRLVDYDFTASMEEDLDAIAAGQKDRVDWLTRFYFGEAEGPGSVADDGLRELVANLGEIDAREVNSIEIGDGITLRVGRYGPYIEESGGEPGPDGNPRRASVPDDLAPDELTAEKARELLETQPEGDLVLGTDPTTGTTIVAKNGRYGPYVTELLPEPELDPGLSAAAKKRALAAAPKPRTGSLLKSQSLQTITLDEALQLLSLPRVVGTDPESGAEITAQNGRYGPYLKKGTDSRTLPSQEAIFTTTLEEALAIYAQPKRGRGATATPPLRELGEDPTSNKPIVVKDGRFGAYVTDGETNRTLPRDVTPESITREQAVELLAEKRASSPKKKPAAKKAAAPRKKAAAKK
jgi:DNA topoisomerase-1